MCAQERWISPLAVRFSQGKIHPFFHERGPISEAPLHGAAEFDLLGDHSLITPLAPSGSPETGHAADQAENRGGKEK